MYYGGFQPVCDCYTQPTYTITKERNYTTFLNEDQRVYELHSTLDGIGLHFTCY